MNADNNLTPPAPPAKAGGIQRMKKIQFGFSQTFKNK